MEQHPVPQHISSYEFRLVGDMTLKQFGYLCGGTILALIVYGLPLPSYFKWPAIMLFGFLGFALAFLPIQERPLSTWLLAFFKAIFSPTQYLWRKEPKVPEIFATSALKPIAQTPTISANRDQLNEYLKTLPSKKRTDLDQKEEVFLKKIGNIYQLTPIMPKSSPPAFVGKVSQPEVATPRIGKPYMPFNQPPVENKSQPAPFRPTSFNSTSFNPPPVRPVFNDTIPKVTPTTVFNQPFNQPFKPFAPKPDQPNWPKTVTTFKPPRVEEQKPLQAEVKVVHEIPIITPKKPVEPVVTAKISPQLPIPAPPTRPNILVGMVVDNQGNMAEGAILEIRNQGKIPVRALKTNRLGQFMIATGLEDGVYEIETEKEGMKFDIIKIEAKGEIIKPIEIRAKSDAAHHANVSQSAPGLTRGVIGA